MSIKKDSERTKRIFKKAINQLDLESRDFDGYCYFCECAKDHPHSFDCPISKGIDSLEKVMFYYTF